MTIKTILKMFGLITVLLIGACNRSYDDSKTKRIEMASDLENQDTILIGVAWADKEASFVKGAQLAVKEFNTERVLGKSIELVLNDGEGRISNNLTLRQRQDITVEVARSFAANSRIVAVIGHRSSSQAIPASIVYQFHGITFIAPTSTNLNLTTHNFNYVFRMTPNNEEIATQLANYCHQKGYRKIVILHSKSSYGTELADTFVSSVAKNPNTEKEPKTEIVLRRSFFSNKTDFSDLMVELKGAGDFDAIFIATGANMAVQIYQDTRNMALNEPFIGAEGLDFKPFWDAIKEWEFYEQVFPEKSAVPTLFKTTAKVPISQKFIANFNKEYDFEADHYAALGYDSIRILVHGIKKSNSIKPFKIAETLRYMPPCQAVTGQYVFKRNGDVRNRPFHFKLFRHGQFEYEEVESDVMNFDKYLNPGKRVWDCADIDIDQDGIPNNRDACPEESPEDIARIDKNRDMHQAGLFRGCLVDNDYDRVPDFRDKCLNTKPHESEKGIDLYGCPMDTDNDKVPDYRDDCPKDGRFEIRNGIDSKGCSIDTDKDEVPDYKDVCPRDTSEELAKGIEKQGERIGCPIDSDNDHIPDYLDACPHNLPNEIEKWLDLRGCPFDRDQDDVPDYRDSCPKNKSIELIKGVDLQGCPIDTDKDGVPDYQDACIENSPTESSNGVFQQGHNLGCPIDSDQDGVPDYRDDCLKNSPIETGKGVDSAGCPLDTDKDGVLDYKDVCFNNSPKEIEKGVHQQGLRIGCPMDEDQDGVPDYRDSCPNNSRFEMKRGVDSRGCPRR